MLCILNRPQQTRAEWWELEHSWISSQWTRFKGRPEPSLKYKMSSAWKTLCRFFNIMIVCKYILVVCVVYSSFTPSQYSSHLDELPACLGGRENGWRFLSQEVLLRNITRENIKSETTGSVAAHLKKERSWGQLTFSHFSRQQLSQRFALTFYFTEIIMRQCFQFLWNR